MGGDPDSTAYRSMRFATTVSLSRLPVVALHGVAMALKLMELEMSAESALDNKLVPRSRARSQEVITRVIGAVRRLLARTGYEAMTMRQVAEATGKSTGVINYHFARKRGLMLAVLDHELANLTQHDRELLRGAVKALETVSPKGDRFWIDMLSMADADELVAQRMKVL